MIGLCVLGVLLLIVLGFFICECNRAAARLGHDVCYVGDVLGQLVQIVDKSQGGLSDETVDRLRGVSSRSFSSISDDPTTSYQNGLDDGATILAQYLLNKEGE